MAEKIIIGVELDSKQAQMSVEQIKAKIKELKKDLSGGLLNPAAVKQSTAELAKLNSQLDRINKTATNFKSNDSFGNFADSIGVLNIGMAAANIGIASLNDGTEEMARLQRNFGIALQATTVLQQVANIESVRSKLAKYQEIIATRLSITTKKAEGNTTKGLIVIQKLWNAAISANPIGALIAAIAALIAIGVILWNLFKDQTEEVKNYNKALDGTIIKNDEVRKSHNDTITNLRLTSIEYDKLAGKLTEQEAALESLKVKQESALDTFKKTNQKKLEDEEITQAEYNLLLSDFLKGQFAEREIFGIKEKNRQDAADAAELERIQKLNDEKEEKQKQIDIQLQKEREAAQEKIIAQKDAQITEEIQRDIDNEKRTQDAELAILEIKADSLDKLIELENKKYEIQRDEIINTGGNLAELELLELEHNKNINQIKQDQIDKDEEQKQNDKDDEDTQLQEDREYLGARLDIFMEGYSMISDAINNAIKRNSDLRLEQLDEQYNKELELLDKNKEQGLISEDEYNKQKKAIEDKNQKAIAAEKTKQAKAEKRAALIDIAIQTAVAVAKIWGQTGVGGIALGPLALAMGAIQAAIVAAQPIPKFQSGGQFGGLVLGPSHAAGGILTPYGEIEGREFIVNTRQTDQNLPLLNAINSSNGDMIGEMNKRLDALIELNSRPTRAYVSESDITTSQTRIKYIQQNATI